MLHNFFQIDKSPVLALAKNNFLKVALLATVTGVAIFNNAQPAQAQFVVINVNVEPKNVVKVLTGGAQGRFVQTYFGYIPPSGSQYMR